MTPGYSDNFDPPATVFFDGLTENIIFTTVPCPLSPLLVHFSPTFAAVVFASVLKSCGNVWPVYGLPRMLWPKPLV